MSSLLVQFGKILLLFALLGGCNNELDDHKPSGSAGSFSIPSDGRLTDEQVLAYLAIQQKIKHRLKQREKKQLRKLISGTPEIVRELPYYDEIEKSSAKEIGVSYSEYIWVKDTVIDTQTSMWLRRYYETNNKIIKLLGQTLNHYNENKASDLEQLERQKMNAYVKEMKKELNDLQKKLSLSNEEVAALEYNSAIVEKYRKDLEKL